MGYLKDSLARRVGNNNYWQTNILQNLLKIQMRWGLPGPGGRLKCLYMDRISAEFQNYVRVFPLKQSLK